jgi:hypothetical protein
MINNRKYMSEIDSKPSNFLQISYNRFEICIIIYPKTKRLAKFLNGEALNEAVEKQIIPS